MKVAEGRNKDIVPCLSCNNCVDEVTAGRSVVRCAVNPFIGKEWELPLEPAEKPKKVFVIGGGPAGMACYDSRLSLLAGMAGSSVDNRPLVAP